MNESYASIYRKACREATRAELAQKLGEIERATHAVVAKHDESVLWCYGTKATCEAYLVGLEREAKLAPMTPELKELASAHKVRAYRGAR